MNIQYLIQLLTNKVTALKNAKIQSFGIGDIDAIHKIDEEILETENTLSQLKLLQSIDTVATAANISQTEVVEGGIAAVQNVVPTVQGPSATASISGYDLSAYATDAEYEGKIQTILSLMPSLEDEVAATQYIQDKAPGSPVTGDMVFAAAKQFDISLPLLLAIMQNDSAFGTKGVGAETNNPGNVGNTGSATHTFGSWGEGVNAVAEWLSLHRAA